MRFKRAIIISLLIGSSLRSSGTYAVSAAEDSVPADPVMRAMVDELNRSVSELQFKDLDKPYFIQYVVLDQERYRVTATFGALTGSGLSRARYVQAQVRVGDYDFDNSEFVTGSGFQGPPPAGVTSQTVIDDDPDVIRHALWLVTDAAYKQAVEQFARKRAFVQNKVRGEQIPDFSKEPPVTAIGVRRRLQIDPSRWEKQVREWSAVFREFPEIEESSVVLEAQLTHRYLVNSEGTRTLQPSMLVSVEIDAGTEAADGMRLRHWIPFNAGSFEQLPSVAEISKAIRQMAADLTALRTAPVLEADYSGPVLFTGQASAEMFARVLVPNLSGQRLPLSDQQQTQTARSELVDRLNRPVLPRFLSVFDDPTAQRIGNQELLGHYQVDDQGVPARRVSLIEQGVLKNFLMSRRPGKDMLQSNGHGRSGIPGRETAQIGNLFIQSSEGKSYEDLKQQLIKVCQEENLPYGILIKALVSDGRSPIGTPVLTYKVHVGDGREELIRGAFAQAIPIRSLRQIEAVGNDSFVINRLAGSSELPTPTSIVAPSVLLEEVELKRPTGTQQKPALLTHPFFSTN
jgi:predicted Zn-dependent protease